MHQTSMSLVKQIEHLTSKERQNQALWFACMVEIDAKGIALELSYSSLFSYLVEGLKYSESSAGKRLQVIKACRQFPRFIELIGQNKLSLSAISMLSKHLVEAYAEELIENSIGRSIRDIERLIVTFAPKPIPREIERKLPEIEPILPLVLLDTAPPPPPPKNTTKPLTAVVTRYGFNGSKEFDEKLRKCRDLLKHKYPAGKLEEVLEAALDSLLAQQTKKLTETKRNSPPPKKHTRYIPISLKREVWKQGEGRCTFVAESGKRCEEKGGLEIDHAKAWAHGGSSWDLTNLRLRCRPHNQYTAKQIFGEKINPLPKRRGPENVSVSDTCTKRTGSTPAGPR